MELKKKKVLLCIALIVIVAIGVIVALIVTGQFSKDNNESEKEIKEPNKSEQKSEYKSTDYTKDYKVVGLGDSFASGEGNPPYKDVQRHISENSWQYQLSINGNKLNDKNFASLTVVSCTGAKTKHIISNKQTITVTRNGREEEHSVPKQISAVAKDTDLVVMSIGGNDAKWTALVESMMIPFKDIDYDEVDKNIVSTINSIDDVVKKIHKAAPNAKIILSNYPRLMEVENYSGPAKLVLTKEERSGLATRVTVFNDKLKLKLKDKSYVYIADVYSEFAGHAVGSDKPFLYGINLVSKLPPVVDNKSFHPNKNGIAAYKKAFQKVIDGFKEEREYKIFKNWHHPSGH